jgi:hypothetical protein
VEAVSEAVTTLVEKSWSNAGTRGPLYGLQPSWRDLSTGFEDPVRVARKFLIDPFGDLVDTVAKQLGETPASVEGAVALALCPPLWAHGVSDRDDADHALIAETTVAIRGALDRAAEGRSIRPKIARELSRRAALDALAAIELGYAPNHRPTKHQTTICRPNARLVGAVYVEDISRMACVQLNKMLYGQLTPLNEDPFTSLLGDGFGVEVVYALALGGCKGTHDQEDCARRRHDIAQWDLSNPDEPPTLPYWIFNLMVGARGLSSYDAYSASASEAELGIKLQVGALMESILPSRLNIAVLKALVLRCRECDRKLDGVSTACLGKRHAVNLFCDVYVQFDDKRVLLNPVIATPAPLRCRSCSGAVRRIGLACPGCSTVVSGGRPSAKTYLPEGVTHPLLRAFTQGDVSDETEDIVVEELMRSLRPGVSDSVVRESAGRIARELNLDYETVVGIAERHASTLRELATEDNQ